MRRAISQDASAVSGLLAAVPPTRWSVVARAGNRDGERWTVALGEIVATYRPVLVRHLISQLRMPPDRAEDMVQAFLAEKLLDPRVLKQASAGKGRFRSFLLKVFSHFVIDQLRRQQALKRRPTNPDAVRLDDLPDLPSNSAALADAFDALWARQVLARTVDRMRDECLDRERRALFGVFEARILGPILESAAPLPYERLVAKFGLRSPSEASNLLITAKRMFDRVLHEVVRETVANGRDVEPEIRELKRILARP
jgi:DNA-directed RNA polymerase specialized sigma24 family protein